MQQVEKIIPQVKMNPKQRKHRDSWQKDVQRYDWDAMDSQQHNLAYRRILKDFYKNNIPFGRRIVLNCVAIVLGVGFFTIVFLMVFTRTDIGWYPSDWDYIFSLHIYLKHSNHGFTLIATMFWLFVITLSLNWLFTDRFYRRESKNLENYMKDIGTKKGFNWWKSKKS